MRSGKVQYLEGLRGIAALQVVLLHFVTGFLPETADHAWPPLRVLFDGHTAVYVFFLISGMVLTPSFARPGAFAAKLIKRVIRLGIPVAAAAAIAAVLLALLPGAHARAAVLSGSAWLATDSSGAATLAHLAREIGLDSLVLGYREATLFAPLAQLLPPMEHSLDAPFWSLHLELYGSLLVLCLVWLRGCSAWLHRVGVLVTALLFGTHPMFLFVLGHVVSFVMPRLDTKKLGAGLAGAGAILLGCGLALSATKDWRVVDVARTWISHIDLVTTPNLFQFASQLAAMLVFAGVLLCPPAQMLLERRPCRHIGRLSFSIYLLHFPILFTVICQAFIWLRRLLPVSIAVVTAFFLFIALTLLAASLFERWIDRPAITLSRRAGADRLQVA